MGLPKMEVMGVRLSWRSKVRLSTSELSPLHISCHGSSGCAAGSGPDSGFEIEI